MLESAIERLGENGTLAGGALLIGVLFGFMAQRSRFCLRAAVIEFARNQMGGKLTVWLFAFATAVGVTQALAWAGAFDAGNARQIATRGSLSGAAIGGALFGMGMILARGCSSRLLVLAAQGNLRSLLSGLIFAVTAQSALTGALSPLRQAISEWWTIDGGGARDLIARTGIGHGGALAFALVWLVAAVLWARRQRVSPWGWGGAIGVGLSVAAGWWFTYAVSRLAFDPHPIQSLSFTGPSSELLTRVLFVSDKPLSFDLGVVPGVFLGSFLAAALFRELKLEGFEGGASMRRYIVGALCMGFGGMLAGGCAVGAGLSGAAVFTATSWVTLCTMWAAAALTDRLVDQHPAAAVDPPRAATSGHPGRALLMLAGLTLVLGAAGPVQAQPLQPRQVSPTAWFVQGEAALGSAANRNFISNAGFVVTNQGVVVIDALGSPALAQELVAAIRKVTDQPIRTVVVTHYHADHIYGLQVFKALGATIIAHRAGREYLNSDTAQLRLQASRAELAPWVDERTQLVPADRWIDADTVLQLGDETLHIRHVGPAHTPEDLVVFADKAGVLFAGDLVFRGRIPFVGQADSRGWIDALGGLIALQPKVVVPGHGPLSTEPLPDLRLTRDYLQYLRQSMGRAAQELEPFEEAYARTDWSRFEHLPLFRAANRINAYNTYLLMEQQGR